MQISLKNLVLAAALAAVPAALAADTGNQVNAGGDCNEPAVFKCVSDGSAVAICSNSKWVSFTCPPGTVCRDNFCQWPAQASDSASDEAETSAAPAAESITTSAVLKNQESTVSAEPTSESVSSSMSSEAPEDTSSSSEEGGSGELGSLTCNAFSKAVQAAGYPAP
ncbi:hypothetical protein H4R34_006052, partial [Dimargaris verticillata]